MSFVLMWHLVSEGLVLNLEFLPVTLAASSLGAVLPDILEPPRNRRHRKFFHSILFLTLLLSFLDNVYTAVLISDLADKVTIGLLFAGAGYASHLVLDSLTPAGLPVVGLS